MVPSNSEPYGASFVRDCLLCDKETDADKKSYKMIYIRLCSLLQFLHLDTLHF